MRARIAVGALLPLLLLAGPAIAGEPPQVVHVKLEDATVDPAMAHMKIGVDPATVRPGRVTFEALNESRSLAHELIVVHDGGALPYDAGHDRVVEHDVRRIGEVADLAPGQSGSVTVNLGPGTYVLFCNEPGHYKEGMSAKFVVAP